jgi:hypothetical protein
MVVKGRMRAQGSVARPLEPAPLLMYTVPASIAAVIQIVGKLFAL